MRKAGWMLILLLVPGLNASLLNPDAPAGQATSGIFEGGAGTDNSEFPPASPASSGKIRTLTTINRKAQAGQVKKEFLHAWRNYLRYAAGHDDLRPLTRKPFDWYGESLLMTPVDALDTMILMGLTKEAEQTRAYVRQHLSFDKDISVSNFEITIRLLGGLLSIHQLTGDPYFLKMADDLGRRLLPVFESPTGIPYRFVNLKTGQVSGNETNPAEAGTLLLEFGTLSRLTGKSIYYEKAKRAQTAIFQRRSPLGLAGQRIDAVTGRWTNPASHISAEIDSYYEYLLKSWLLFGDPDAKRMWEESLAAIHRHLAEEVDGGLWYGQVHMETGERLASRFGALDAFFPAVLVLAGDLERARRLQESCFKMWNLHGIEPEIYNYRTRQAENPGYPLRPEIVESTWYLYQATGDPAFQEMGATLLQNFIRHCRTKHGYASLRSVITKEKADEMQSFLFAETFKYFYLLFAPPGTLDLGQAVLNTEAHPLRKINAAPAR